MEKINTTERLTQLRELMKRNKVDIYIVPSEDSHQSEYIAPADARRGSAGTAVITQEKAALATDGRYFNQAEKQLDSNWTLLKQGLQDVPTWQEWSAEQSEGGKTVGVDPTTITAPDARKLSEKIKKKGGKDLVAVKENLVDSVWGSARPARPNEKVDVLTLDFAGKKFQDKIDDLRKDLDKKKSAGFVVSMLDEVAWLYNLRGSDIPYNPVFFSYALISPTTTTLYIDDSKLTAAAKTHLSGVEVRPYDAIFTDMEAFSSNSTGESKYLVSNKASWALYQALGGEDKVDFVRSLIGDAKAIKNETEMKGMRECHIRDGAALSEFFAWLEDQLINEKATLDEVEAADKLESIRSKHKHFVGLSFDTISSTGANAAVIHYKPEPGACSVIDPKAVYLCDSGAQYYDGTTDTTRTMHFGEPTDMERKAYTLVLKGHIALDNVKFPKGTTGYAIDVLARQFLWAEGLDYRHGTGHGVGSFLNVHEGPIGIGTRVAYSEVPLAVGNVISNEPGYYEDGAFGIRIENMFMVTEKKTTHQFGDKAYLGFEHVTMTPMCRKLTDESLLSSTEKEWLNDYHSKVYEKTKGYFTHDQRTMKRNRTRFAVGAGTLGLVYLAGQYAWSKWLEARQRMADERMSKDNLRRRFEQNQEDCTYTVLALLPTIREEIISTLPVEDITNELQRQRSEKLSRSAGQSEAASSDFPSAPASTIDDSASMSSFQTGSYIHASQMVESQDGKSLLKKKTKAQLWNDMKISSITRSLTLLYTLSLLTLLTRIQLNLLGRRTYLSSVVSLANPPTATDSTHISMENNDDDNYDNVYGNDFETNRKYLTFSWWLLHKGSKQIVDKVSAAVKDVFGPVNPREDMTLERLSELILDVRKKVEGATESERREHRWLSYMLPPRDEEDFVLSESGIDAMSASPAPQDTFHDPMLAANAASSNLSLRRLLDETSDLIDSPTFTHVFTQVLNATFSHLIDYRVATEAFKISPPAPDSMSRITEISDKKCKFAQTLAVFCRQAHIIAAGSSEPDDLVVAESAGSQVNEYLAAIDQVKDLEAFAAVIYSSNFEFEAAEKQQVEVNATAPIMPILGSASAPAHDLDAPAQSGAQEPALSLEEMNHAWNRSQAHDPSAPNAPSYSEVVQAPAPESSSSQHHEAQESQSTQEASTTSHQPEQPKTYAMAAAPATTIPPLTLIVASTAKNGIGKNGTLPWPMLKKEMAYFARVTKRVPRAASTPDSSMLAETSSQPSDSSEVAATAKVQAPQNVVIMGRKTWESILPRFRPLPQRTNVVISRSEKLDGVGEDVIVGNSIASALSSLTTKVKQGQAAPLGRVFVIGGGAIYKQALDMEEAKSILLTRVDGEWDCDTDFPVNVEAEQTWTRREKSDLDEFTGEDVQQVQEEEVKGEKVRYEFRLYEKV
ncbi:hypothetical protein E4T39_01371 [Aureobasidium subglaciale]|nr:hypothetical protein E4T39_01371 [Aureobasidium subglaciale]